MVAVDVAAHPLGAVADDSERRAAYAADVSRASQQAAQQQSSPKHP